LIFNERKDVSVVAVADVDVAGREKAIARTRAARGYADYREMLEREKPQLVSVAPRWTNEHHAMTSAALKAGAHVFSEKPFTQTLTEADDLLGLAKEKALKIVVAHQIRLAPQILFLKQRLAEGLIGELLEMRAHGKQDTRAGGEDLLVLGVHLFDLMRFFGGDALWCTARVLQNGNEATLSDARLATEGIGRVLGNEIFAQFGFANGVNGSFTSRARNREVAGPWGIELIGTKSVVRIFADIWPRIYLAKRGDWTADGSTVEWRRIEGDPSWTLPAGEKTTAQANTRLVNDWLDSIEKNREPVCSGYAGMKALEMVMAVFEAGLARTRVELPLKKRGHPLGT
jgi:predicted dehydrogenase